MLPQLKAQEAALRVVRAPPPPAPASEESGAVEVRGSLTASSIIEGVYRWITGDVFTAGPLRVSKSAVGLLALKQ